MKSSVNLWQFFGFAVVSLLGTLLHFVYEWTGESILAAPFSGVNESTWEHMKLLYWPLLLFAIVQSFFFRNNESFWCIKLYGTMVGLVLIPVLFYTLNGAFGKTPDYVNITIFFLSAASAFFFEGALLKKDSFTCKLPGLSIFLLILIGILFIFFTFATPKIPLFRDPINGSFGISLKV